VQASPREVVQPRWTSGSFLVYAGGAFVVVALVKSLTVLARHYGDAAFVGWTALMLFALVILAASLRRAGSWVAEGVFATIAVAGWGAFLAALERWFGWLPGNYTPLRGFHLGVFLLVLLVLAAAVAALWRLRFPLLAALVAAASGFFVTDLISNGGNWSAVVSLLLGLAFYAAALVVDGGPSRPYAFWLHVAAGVAVGGALLWFWHESNTDWALVAAAGVAYVAIAALTRRSSYAVLGAVGLYLAAIHFVEEWAGQTADAVTVVLFLVFLPFSENGYYEGRQHHVHDWSAPLIYALLGFLLVALGLLHERRGSASY
jgi:hypothetical protein